jgi:phage terminase small subunit
MSLPAVIDVETRRFPHLTVMQEAFVAAYVANGGKRIPAAKAAGYKGSGLHVTVSRLMHNTNILKAIHELSLLELAALAPTAIRTLAKLSDGAKSEYIRLQASTDVLDRVGMAAPKQVNVGVGLTVQIDLS